MSKGESAVLVCDDLSRIPVRSPLLRRLFFRIFTRAVRARLRRMSRGQERVTLIANPEHFSAAEQALDPSYVFIRGTLSCDVPAVLRFSRAAVSELNRSLAGTAFAAVGELVELRLFVASLIEYMVKSTEAFHDFFTEKRPQEVRGFSGATVIERIAMQVAQNRGIRVSAPGALSPWRWVFRVKNAVWLRNRHLPKAHAVIQGWEPKSAVTGPCDVIIFAEEERRLRRALPIAQALRRAGLSVKVFTVPFKKESRASLKELRDAGITAEYLTDVLSPEEYAGIKAAAPGPLAKAWQDLEANAGQLPLYRGVRVWDLFGAYFRNGWPAFSLNAAFAAPAARTLMATHRPKAVVLNELGVFSRALLDAGKQAGVRTYWYSNNPIAFTIDYWVPLLLSVFRCDRILATCEFMKETLVARGYYEPHEVIVTGDAIVAPPNPHAREAAENLRRGWGVQPGQKVMLCLSAYIAFDVSEDKLRRYHQESFAIAREAGAALVIKAHPNQGLALLREQLAGWGVTYAALLHTESLMATLAASDLAMMMFSQAGNEVLMAEVPLAILQDAEMIQIYDRQYPYIREGAAAGMILGEAGKNQATVKALLHDDATRARAKAQGAKFVQRFITAKHADNAEFFATALKKDLEAMK